MTTLSERLLSQAKAQDIQAEFYWTSQMKERHKQWAADLRAAAALIQAAEWRPIETAPKDGTTALVNDTTPGYTPWVAASYSNGGEWSGWVYDDPITADSNPFGPNPTHWLPITAAPTGDKA